MKKLDFFLRAMRAEEFRRTEWVLSAFALIQEDPEKWKTNPYAYRIVQTGAGHFFVDPDNDNQLTLIDDAEPGQPPFALKDRFRLPANMVPNQKTDVETNYGILLANYIMLVYPFGEKVPFKTGRWGAQQVADEVLSRIVDDPELVPGSEALWAKAESMPPEKQPITVSEYLKFTQSAFYLPAFSQITIPAHSARSLQTDPQIAVRKAQLLEQYKDQLHDAAVIAKIEKELVEMDKAWIKGDSSEGFLALGANKNFGVVRKKLYLMLGSETGLSTSLYANLIKNSLEEGWEVNKFPDMNNSSRAGSYDRGAQTMLGGESVKWLFRATTNINVVKGDCGTKLGNLVVMDDKNLKKYLGFGILDDHGSTTILTGDNGGSYLGKAVRVRSPMFCKSPMTDYCEICIGPRLAATPYGAATAISEMGSVMMLISMKAMHGKVLATQKWDFKTQIF